VTCVPGTGVALDGIDDYVNLQDWAFGDAPLTVETYVNYAAFNSWSKVFDFGNGENLDNVFLSNQLTGGDATFAVVVGNGSEYAATASAVDVFEPVNTWAHVVVTVEGNTLLMYHDCVLVANTTSPKAAEPRYTTRANHWLGRSNYPADSYLEATIGFLSVWQSQALDQNQVCGLFGGKTLRPSASPTAEITFDPTSTRPPTDSPTVFPTLMPTFEPTLTPQPTAVPSMTSAPTQAPTSSLLPSSTPAPTSCQDYTVIMSDSFGDGWDGTVLYLTDTLTFTLPETTYYGYSGNLSKPAVQTVCLPCGVTFYPYACGGLYSDEAHWEVK
jgi:hypothetical protein